MNWIETYTGKKVYPLYPNPDMFCAEDIAHALSLQCRYNGHVPQFYSVAQHSVLVSQLVDTHDALWGLLHDAAEAYLSDIPSPVKGSGDFEFYRQAEDRILRCMAEWAGLSPWEPFTVCIMDRVVLAAEHRDVFRSTLDWADPELVPDGFRITRCWQPKEAEDTFRMRWEELTC